MPISYQPGEQIMQFRPIKKQYLDTDTTNQLLAMLKQVPKSIHWEKPDKDTFISTQIYIWEEAGCFNVLGRYLLRAKITLYKHPLDDRKVDGNISEPKDIIRAFKAHYGDVTHDIVKEDKKYRTLSISPLQFQDKRYQNQVLKDCYCYDLNSAYAAFAIQPLPDTTRPLGAGIVQSGQIGFRDTGNVILHTDKYTGKQEVRSNMTTCQPGEYATFRFPLIESPFKKYFLNQFDKKNNPKNDTMKKNAKNSIIITVGNFQNINPFLRITIVDRANKFIKQWSDSNTIFCNTDSIVSLVRRDDLDVGDQLGQFKIEHHGDFKYIGSNYTWSDGHNAHRGKTIVTQKFDRDNWRIVAL